jgi:hypothetical protein
MLYENAAIVFIVISAVSLVLGVGFLALYYLDKSVDRNPY